LARTPGVTGFKTAREAAGICRPDKIVTEPADAPDGQIPRGPATATISALQEAIKQGVRVWIGYLDSQGNATSRILEPARMEGGYLTAYDETRAAVHRFALHRITGVAGV
ncbi:WYL domain-containing protein, partial [Nonomuraea wenchangensis]